MRCLKLLAVILFTAAAAHGQSPAPLPKETVKFDGHTLALASQEGNDAESLKEYIPAGETLDKWTRLASIHVFSNLNDPLAAVAAVQAELKKEYPDAPSRIIKNDETGEAVIDFVIISPDSAFAEWNVMKYVKNKEGGLTVYQYAMRAYGDKMKEFLAGLKPERLRLVDMMAKDGLVLSK